MLETEAVKAAEAEVVKVLEHYLVRSTLARDLSTCSSHMHLRSARHSAKNGPRDSLQWSQVDS